MVAMRTIEARYEKGLLKPETPLPLRQGEPVSLIVVRQPDSRRWNLDRLREGASQEDLDLAEQGICEWAIASGN